MIVFVLMGVTLAAAACALRFGDRDERIAVAILTTVTFGTPFVDDFQSGSFRWAEAGLDTLAFLGLTAIALGRRRWWPIPLAGFQLIVVFSHAVGLAPDFFVRTAVTVRLLAWCGILLALFFAAYEAHVVRRYGLEPNHG